MQLRFRYCGTAFNTTRPVSFQSVDKENKMTRNSALRPKHNDHLVVATATVVVVVVVVVAGGGSGGSGGGGAT